MAAPDVPDVSVVIPVYNTAAYLPSCLDSLLRQSIGRERFEVVAVDDGSTDGSGPLLDEYAERHPDVVRVIHQANSGGPARPCNVGLDHARGRFVFFIGSDDHLADDGLERMVAAADAWEADVVVPPMVGVNGRNVDQRLFEQDTPDMPFPHSGLPFSVSNTKLFRRSLVAEHSLRYPLDLRVGSDQPFAIAAMLAARRIGVLGTPHIYFAVRRDDADNISYATGWHDRLTAIAAVMEHICEIVPAGDDRDAILHRHFVWELQKMLTRNLPEVAAEERTGLVAELGAVAERFYTPGIDRRLKVVQRLRWWLARHGDAEGLLGVVDPPQPRVVVAEDRLHLALPGFRSGVPDEVFRPTSEKLPKLVLRALGQQHAAPADDRLVITAEGAGLTEESSAHLELALIPADGTPPPVRTITEPVPGTLAVPVVRDQDGRLCAAVDLQDLARDAPDGGRWSARWQLRADGHIYDVPVRSPQPATTTTVRRRLRTLTIHVRPGVKDRIVVEVRS